MTKLVHDDVLERSAVVANCRMNRERNLAGSNGYARELGFHPLDFLQNCALSRANCSWLDICCGSGTALIEASEIVHREGITDKIEIVGIDLIGMFSNAHSDLKCLRFITSSISVWQPNQNYDLITCVHGLHYIGDKLNVVARAISWLTDEGQFTANFDLRDVQLSSGGSASRLMAKELRKNGIQYDSRKKRLRCVGRRSVQFPFRYLGADDEAGPNYTGQPAVRSYYE